MEGSLTYDQRAWRWRLLISTFLGYAGFYFCRKVFGLVKTSLDEQFGWGLDFIAYIWVVFLTAYMLGQFVNGYVGRKWGPRVLLLGGLGISIICNIVFAFIDSKDTMIVPDGPRQGISIHSHNSADISVLQSREDGPVLTGQNSFGVSPRSDGDSSIVILGDDQLEIAKYNDQLFAYAYLDATSPPQRLFVTWHTSVGDRTAYWGEQEPAISDAKFVGALPKPGRWARLGIPMRSLLIEPESSKATGPVGWVRDAFLQISARYFSDHDPVVVTGLTLASEGGRVYWDDLGISKYTSYAYFTFMLFMFFNGLVQACGWPGSVGSVSQWIRPHERGFIMGGWGTSYVWGNIGVKVVGSTLLGLGLIAVMPSWRFTFLGCTAVAFVIWWIVYFWQRNKPQDVGLQPIVDVTADEEGRAIRASSEEHVGIREYLRLATNPLIIAMGLGYFFIKFLRYALDSWLPTFLTLQGLSKQEAGLYSVFFDIGGILPCIFIGWVLDRYFKGDWARLTFIASIGLVLGYFCVLQFEANPLLVAICFGFVGFMIYGPDTLLCGAASVAVAGEMNGVAVAGLVNGIGSIGPIVQEIVIGRIISGDDRMANIHTTNLMAFWMSVAFAVMMLVVMWRVKAAHAGNKLLDDAVVEVK
ncbi:MAG: MFS transporter [Candidatus Hydrogenedentes bacterium]|nr:MFS transporter [Candidatus Hydrogenedentota bacterium]